MVAALLFLIVCLTAAGVTLVTWKWREAVVALGEAAKEKKRAQDELVTAETARYAIQIGLAQREWRKNDLLHAEETLGHCSPDLSHWEHAYLRRLCADRVRSIPAGHTDEVRLLTLSPDGQSVATAAAFWNTPRDGIRRTDHVAGGEVRVHDVRTGKELFPPLKHSDRVLAMAFSPDGTRLLSVGTVVPLDAEHIRLTRQHKLLELAVWDAHDRGATVAPHP